MYEIIKIINETTFIGCRDADVYIMKKIHIEDSAIYKKLMGISCENIARVFELTVIDGDFYAVCEYVNGCTVKQYYEQHGNFTDYEVKKFACQLCDGLNAIHSAGIVHRDINPNNVMLTNDGNVKIIDFGISRVKKENLSADTQILGTHGYAAPEQYGFSQTTGKTDIYAVGVLMNYMKTGCLPAEKTAAGEIGRIIGKCIQMDENKRYNDVMHLKRALCGGSKFRRVLSYVPGFSQRIVYREILAGIYYLLAADLTLYFFTSGTVDEDGIKPWQLGIFVFILLFLPVPFIGNSGSWTEKRAFVKNKSKQRKIAVRFGLGIGVTAAVLFLYIFILS
ncbi:MAG: serine/threonine protein kinase [Clostridia bacterium]|nr:serine/threonine protein kinase [Clostridia bacterium]